MRWTCSDNMAFALADAAFALAFAAAEASFALAFAAAEASFAFAVASWAICSTLWRVRERTDSLELLLPANEPWMLPADDSEI